MIHRTTGVLTVSILLAVSPLTAEDQVSGSAQGDEKQESPRNLTIDDQFRIKSVGGPTISPDGKWIAYTVTTPNFEMETSHTRIWKIAIEGGTPIPMTSEKLSSWSPTWGAKGRYLYFLSARHDEKSQVWALDLRHGGEARKITEIEQGAGSIEWSPDGKRLALVIRDPDPDEADEKKDEHGKVKVAKPWIIDRLQFKADYVGYLDRRRRHVYIYDVNSKKLTQITSGDYDDSSPKWSPNGKTIAFVSNRTEEPDNNVNTDIWLVDADNTDKGKNLIQITSDPGTDRSPVWHPGGKSIAYLAAPSSAAIHYATTHLGTISLDGGDPDLLTLDLDRMVSRPEFSEDGRYIYFSLADSGEQHIVRIPSSGGKINRLITGNLSASSFTLGSDGSLVARVSTPVIPGELFVAEKRELRQLTHVNDEFMSNIRLGETEEIHFKSHDGLEIEGFVIKPPSFNPAFRYPTLLRIHGGPFSQYSYSFSFQAQLFAAHDYVVVRSNPRGSSAYGEEFAKGLLQGWGEKDYRDVLAAVDHVIDMGYADPDRLGVGGYSYGGILTNYLITQTGRFKAATSGAGSALYVASYGHDQYQQWYESEIGLPWENRELWERLSPFNYIQDVTTPTLFVCGEKDWNVPVQNSEQLYQALRRLGIETRLIVYPGEHHGGWAYRNTQHVQEQYLAWYDKYVKSASSDRPVASMAD
ncbi:MAG: S9 family peptidase [Acidobacteriota bacterium]